MYQQWNVSWRRFECPALRFRAFLRRPGRVLFTYANSRPKPAGMSYQSIQRCGSAVVAPPPPPLPPPPPPSPPQWIPFDPSPHQHRDNRLRDDRWRRGRWSCWSLGSGAGGRVNPISRPTTKAFLRVYHKWLQKVDFPLGLPKSADMIFR